jgi:hypothetical protein
MRRDRVCLAAALLILSVSFAAGAGTYALYYDLSGARDTALVVMNSGGQATHFTLKLYDAYGARLDPKADSWDVAAYASTYLVLSSLVATGQTHFGLCLLETPGLLTIGVETAENGTWRASENMLDAVAESGGYTYYWYGANYSNTPKQKTGIAVVNPSASPAAGTLFLYDSSGNVQKALDFVLDPHETNYYALETILPVAETMWGVADVKATAALVLATAYVNEAGTLLNVDQEVRPYYTE